MFWILLSIALTALVYYALIKPFKFWKDQGVEQYPIWVIWRETLLSFVQYRTMLEIFQPIYDNFPNCRYVGYYSMYQTSLFIKDPDLIKQLMVKDFDHFVDRFQYIPDNTEPLWEKNLSALKGDKWRDMRSTLSPSFTSSKMKAMFGLVSDCAKDFVNYFLEQNQKVVSIEMKDTFSRFTNDVIASTAFGISCNSLKDRDNEFYKMGYKITNFSGFWENLKFMMKLMLPELSKKLGIKLFDCKTSNFFEEIIKNNISIREKEGIVRQDMLQLLIEARKGRVKNDTPVEEPTNTEFSIVDNPIGPKEEIRRKEQLTDQDITAQALIFFFAGFDGVSILMSFMAHELAVNPDLQERLQAEIDDALNDCDGSITYEALTKMKYMDMVVSETLRKWPVGVALDRVCVKPYTIQPVRSHERAVHLKKGDLILVSLFRLHRNPEVYPEPERFDPERFSDENKGNIKPYTYLPFGAGPRICIGNRFALMEIKLIFFHILSKFDLIVIDKTTVPIQLSPSQFQVNAKNGFWLGMKTRASE